MAAGHPRNRSSGTGPAILTGQIFKDAPTSNRRWSGGQARAYAVQRSYDGGRQSMTTPNAPLGLPKQSALTCPYCLWNFAGSSSEPDSPIEICPSCGTKYHADCFAENGGCAVFGCPAWTSRQMELSDVGAAPQVALHNLPLAPSSPPLPAAPRPAYPPPRPRQAYPPPPNGTPQHPEVVQRFCDQCGVTISAGDNFCGSCGSPVYRGAS